MAYAWPNRGVTRRFGLWLGGTMGVALAGWGAVTAAQYALDRWRPPPAPIAAQLTDVVREAARDGLRVAESYEADLRGSGEMSRILVLRPTARSTREAPNELRIYDVSDRRLRLRFRFVPVAAGPTNPSIAIHLAEVADLDSNGSTEVVVSLEESYVEHDTAAPALVGWDPRSDTYGIAPLLTPDASKLEATPRPRVVARGRLSFFTTPTDLYLEPLRIRNAATGATFRSYATASFVVRRSTFSSYLLTGFDAGVDRRGLLSDLNVWSLGDLGLPPLVYACVNEANQVVTIPYRERAHESDAQALVRVWNAKRDALSC